MAIIQNTGFEVAIGTGWSFVGGAAAVDATTHRSGAQSGKLAANATTQYVGMNHAAAKTIFYFLGYGRLATLTPGSAQVVLSLAAHSGTDLNIQLSTSNVLQAVGDAIASGPTLAATTYYGLECEYDVSANPRRLRWRTFDPGTGLWTNQPDATIAQAADTLNQTILQNSLAAGPTWNWDDVQVGEGTVQGEHYPASRTAPVISSITAAAGSVGATIAWLTDLASDSLVEYGLTGAYGSSTTLDPTLVTGHSVPITGLSPSTLYHYRVTSSNGTPTTSGDQTFTTGSPTAVDNARLIYERTTQGPGLIDTLPRFLLTSGLTYAWQETLYDTDGLATDTPVSTFFATFAQPDPVTGLVATPDTDNGSIVLTWDASADAFFDHYRVYWTDAAGTVRRIDDGPASLDDGLTPLTLPTFTHYGARLGDNLYQVTQHNGALESDPTAVVGTLATSDTGRWMRVEETDGSQFTFEMRVIAASRLHGALIDSFQPPGRGSTVHLKWGGTGQAYQLTLQLRPTVDGDLSTLLEQLLVSLQPGWWKAPAGWLFDTIWATVVALTDTTGVGGMLQVSVDIEETERS